MTLAGTVGLAPQAEAAPAAAPRKAGGHVPALDGVRGIAVLLVMIYHLVNSLGVLGVRTPLFKPFDLGWCGVDVFFALSGFLITGILLDTKDSPNYFKSFYVRRVLRIFPLYYVALVAVLVIQTALPEAGVWGERATVASAGSLLWPAVFLENAALLIGGIRGTGITTHYWSLAVEEHFYLLWPLLVWLARDRRQVAALAAAGAAASVLARLVVLKHGASLSHMFGATPLRIDGLAIGALTAVAVRSWPARRLVPWALAALAGSIAAEAGLVLLRRTMSQTDPALWLAFYPLMSTTAAAAVVLCLGAPPFAWLMSRPGLRWFGKYSYGLYVWHPIIGVMLFHSSIALTRAGDPIPRVLAAAVVVEAIVLLVAWLSYQLWEKRFLALKGLFSAGSASAAGAAVAAPNTLQA